MKSIQDLREQRRALQSAARKLNDDHPGAMFTRQISDQFEKTMAQIDDLDREIATIQRELDDHATRAFGQGGDGNSWTNGQGKRTFALSREQKVVDVCDSGQRPEFSFGQLLGAMVGGTQNPAIRNALSESTDSTGGYTVPKHLIGQVIDMMRAKSVCIQAGATTVILEGKDNTIARLANDPTATWRNENDAVAISDPSFEGVVLQPRSLAVLVKVSRELIDDASNLSEALMQAFAGAMAAELDRVALEGTGVAPEPRGLFHTSATVDVLIDNAANGAIMTNFSPLLDLLMALQTFNAPAPTAMIMHPRTARTFNGWTTSFSEPISFPPAIADIPRLVTTNVSISQTQGTSTDATSIYMGHFPDLLFGMRQELRIELLRETFAGNLQYGFLAHLRADIGVARNAALGYVKGIIP